MVRSKFLEDLASTEIWDVIITGGGAIGLGAAVDSAQRGYKTLLPEKNDYAKGTSSRSTKLVDGGVRYLYNGDESLVIEALKEIGIMKNNDPIVAKIMAEYLNKNESWMKKELYNINKLIKNYIL